MTIKRRHFLEIAGIEEQLFKTLQRRGQVPFGWKHSTSSPDASDGDEVGGYTPYDALMLNFADQLVSGNSFSRHTAARLMSSVWIGLSEAVARAEAGEEIWFAAGCWDTVTKEASDDPGSAADWSFIEFGSFDEVVDAIRSERIESKKSDVEVAAVSMFFMTPLVKNALARAQSLNIGIESFIA